MHPQNFRLTKARTIALPSLTFLIFVLLLISGCTSPTGSPPPVLPDKWLVYKQSPGGLINNYINAILLDRGRKIWLATNDGASSFSGGVWGSLRDSLASPTTH